MKLTKGKDPWDWNKHEIDPWNSPWRKKREDALVRGQRPDVDCAFDAEAHHAPAFRRSKAGPAVSGRAPNTNAGADAFNRQLLPFIVCAILLAIGLAATFVRTVLFGLAYYEYISIALSIWLLNDALPLLVILGALALFFRTRLKRASKSF